MTSSRKEVPEIITCTFGELFAQLPKFEGKSLTSP